MAPDLADSARSISASTKKRSRDEDETVLSPQALAHMSRSERKRHREKKRRNDLVKGFDDLTALLIEVDTTEAADRARRGEGADEHLLSRVELISRTVHVLGRVHKENEERKLIIQHLLQKSANVVHSNIGFLDKVRCILDFNSFRRVFFFPLTILRSSHQYGLGLPSNQGYGADARRYFSGLTHQNPTSSLATVPMHQQRTRGPAMSTFFPGDFQAAAGAQTISDTPVSFDGNSLHFAINDLIAKYKMQKSSTSAPNHP